MGVRPVRDAAEGHRGAAMGASSLVVPLGAPGESPPSGPTFDEPQSTSRGSAVRLRGGVAFRWESAGAGVLILAALGCATVPRPDAGLATLGELKHRLGESALVGYRGCDQQLHYFCSVDGRTFSLPRAAWQVQELPVTLGWCLPLQFENDRLVSLPAARARHVDLHALQWALRG
jgi:hypothetical protein